MLAPVPTLSKLRLESIAREVSHEFLDELVALFRSDVEKRLEHLSESILHRQLEQALGSAHTLKGAAASLGVLRLRAVTARLEDYLEREDWRGVDTTLVRLLREFAHVRTVLGPSSRADAPVTP
jgi:HPt (histidine-containing phosphotransfer) domain-containing protein